MEAALPTRSRARRNSGSNIFTGWATGMLTGLVQWIGSIAYVVGVVVLLTGDIYLGGSVLKGIFAHATGWEAWALPWAISIATAAAQMGLWVLVFKQSRDATVFRKAVSIIGGIAALFLAAADTLLDALYSQVLVVGTSPYNLIPEGMGFNVFGLIFVLFAMVSFFGEPIALFLLFANKDHNSKDSEDEEG
jgi:hypothetical protein